MRILGIDTATPIASVALIEDGSAIAEQSDRRQNNGQCRRVGFWSESCRNYCSVNQVASAIKRI